MTTKINANIMNPKVKITKPKRYRVARRDARVGTITSRIEKDYGLPEGSVRLILPNGRKARVDGRIASLLRNWA